MRKVTMVNGAQAWAFGFSQYVQAAVKNVEDHLKLLASLCHMDEAVKHLCHRTIARNLIFRRN